MPSGQHQHLRYASARIFAYDVPACARPSLDVLQELEFEHVPWRLVNGWRGRFGDIPAFGLWWYTYPSKQGLRGELKGMKTPKPLMYLMVIALDILPQ